MFWHMMCGIFIAVAGGIIITAHASPENMNIVVLGSILAISGGIILGMFYQRLVSRVLGGSKKKGAATDRT